MNYAHTEREWETERGVGRDYKLLEREREREREG